METLIIQTCDCDRLNINSVLQCSFLCLLSPYGDRKEFWIIDAAGLGRWVMRWMKGGDDSSWLPGRNTPNLFTYGANVGVCRWLTGQLNQQSLQRQSKANHPPSLDELRRFATGWSFISFKQKMFAVDADVLWNLKFLTCFCFFFLNYKVLEHVWNNATADECETEKRQFIQINKCSLRSWLKVKRGESCLDALLPPIRNFAWIHCFFYVES